MKERPILFSAEMVRAILDGRKTQTRRVIKPQPICTGTSGIDRFERGCLGMDYWYPSSPSGKIGIFEPPRYKCPYGVPGDRLWVRETWLNAGVEIPGCKPDEIWYREDEDEAFAISCEPHDQRPKWRPSIFMPRWASRITLEVTGIRVERVQDIIEGDIRSEGVECPEHDFHSGFCAGECSSLRGAFRTLWDSINKKRGYEWDVNPWCWVISFRKTGDK